MFAKLSLKSTYERLRRNAPLIAALAVVGIPAVLFLLPPRQDRLHGGGSLILLDAGGTELRQFRSSDDGSYNVALPFEEYPDHVIRAVLTAEDGRFYFHPGVDPAAILRAAYQNARAGRIVSGGSTITQQLVRLVYREELPVRPALRKIVEAVLALRLEVHASKQEILTAYLNRVPMPENRTGLAAAAQRLFGRDVRFLSEDEALALAVLIRRNRVTPEAFTERYRRLHAAVHGRAADPPNELLAAVFESRDDDSLTSSRNTLTRAPHFTQWLRELYPNASGTIRTEISADFNNAVAEILDRELQTLSENKGDNAAAVVLSIDDSGFTLRGLVGSRDFHEDRDGQVNGALAIRSAGSTLKPFLYGLAFEEQGLRPYTILEDSEGGLPLSDGTVYRPRNYDLNYWGRLTAREALATSRNIPAVRLVESVGEDRLIRLFENARLLPLHDGERHGPGIALGTAGVRLIDLTRAYAALGNGGRLRPVRLGRLTSTGRSLEYGDERVLFQEQTAHLLSHVLADRPMRRKAFGERSFLDFPFDVAAKTGTSKDYRDAWTVGYTQHHAVGVWVGNFSGEEMVNVSGAFGAGRIFQQIMRLVEDDRRSQGAGPHRFSYPSGWRELPLCRHTGLVARPTCPAQTELIPAGEGAPAQCDGRHDHADTFAGGARLIESPLPGEVYVLDPHLPDDVQQIPLRFADDAPADCSYAVDGEQRGPLTYGTIALTPRRGRHELSVRCPDGRRDSVEFFVE